MSWAASAALDRPWGRGPGRPPSARLPGRSAVSEAAGRGAAWSDVGTENSREWRSRVGWTRGTSDASVVCPPSARSHRSCRPVADGAATASSAWRPRSAKGHHELLLAGTPRTSHARHGERRASRRSEPVRNALRGPEVSRTRLRCLRREVDEEWQRRGEASESPPASDQDCRASRWAIARAVGSHRQPDISRRGWIARGTRLASACIRKGRTGSGIGGEGRASPCCVVRRSCISWRGRRAAGRVASLHSTHTPRVLAWRLELYRGIDFRQVVERSKRAIHMRDRHATWGLARLKKQFSTGCGKNRLAALWTTSFERTPAVALASESHFH